MLLQQSIFALMGSLLLLIGFIYSRFPFSNTPKEVSNQGGIQFLNELLKFLILFKCYKHKKNFITNFLKVNSKKNVKIFRLIDRGLRE